MPNTKMPVRCLFLPRKLSKSDRNVSTAAFWQEILAFNCTHLHLLWYNRGQHLEAAPWYSNLYSRRVVYNGKHYMHMWISRTSSMDRYNKSFAESHRQSRQDKCQSVASPACTDTSTIQRALDEHLELSVHAGDTSEHKIWVGEGQQQWSVGINEISSWTSAVN